VSYYVDDFIEFSFSCPVKSRKLSGNYSNIHCTVLDIDCARLTASRNIPNTSG